MKLSDYLFHRVVEAGAKTVFGIPGDFALPLFAALDRTGTKVATFAHEPALGYAADAYARLNGFAVAVVTYGAGGLNMVNAVAQAYAEKSPVLVISGAPEILSRRRNLMVHHRVKNFETQKRVYDEICCASALIDRVEDAAFEIDYVINKILSDKRPGYLEIPRDLCDCEIAMPRSTSVKLSSENQLVTDASVKGALSSFVDLIARARTPLLYVGVEVRRLGLEDELRRLVERLNLPFTTSMEGKAVLPETHPNFIGTYMGAVGPEQTRQAMMASDLIINVGTTLSDVNLGMFAGGLDPNKMIHMTTDGLTASGKTYPNVTLPTALSYFANRAELGPFEFPEEWRLKPNETQRFGPITTDGVVALINDFVREVPSVLTLDVGDILFASSEIRADVLLAPSYYASMGFAVPAAVAAGIAMPTRRALAVVGDGAFQMTGTELGTAKRLGLSPIVLVLDNGRYQTMRLMDAPRTYYDIPAWDYAKFGAALGATTFVAETLEELHEQLERARSVHGPVLIHAKMARDTASSSLIKMSAANRAFQAEK